MTGTAVFLFVKHRGVIINEQGRLKHGAGVGRSAVFHMEQEWEGVPCSTCTLHWENVCCARQLGSAVCCAWLRRCLALWLKAVMLVWWSNSELKHVPWIMCEGCSLCYVPMGCLVCLPLRPVTVLHLYCNQRADVAQALLYFSNNYQERKHCLLWILFNSAQQLKINTFNYLGEWIVWLESWGKLYDLRIKCCKEPYICNWFLKL